MRPPGGKAALATVNLLRCALAVGALAVGALAVEAPPAAEPPGAVPPAVAGLTLLECVVLEEVEVAAGDVAVDVAVATLDVLVEGVTLDVVVSEEEETPADWVAVELPPQPVSAATRATMASTANATAPSGEAIRSVAVRFAAVLFVGIGGSAYPKGAGAATPTARRF
jgi:hypothetical protein